MGVNLSLSKENKKSTENLGQENFVLWKLQILKIKETECQWLIKSLKLGLKQERQ